MANDSPHFSVTDPPPTQLPLRCPGDVTDRNCVMPVACPVAVTLNESEVRADERRRCKADVCPHCAKGERPSKNQYGHWHDHAMCAAGAIYDREQVEGSR